MLIKNFFKRLLSIRYVGIYSNSWIHYYVCKEIDKGRKTFKVPWRYLSFVLFSYL
jgi:hypothetical protein